MFTLLIMFGGLNAVLSLPFIFRGEMKDYKHPAVIIAYANMFFFILVWVVLLQKKKVYQYLIKSEALFYFIDHPFFLLIAVVAGILMLCLGGIVFKSIDIK